MSDKRLVIKLGTTLLTSGKDHLDLSVMASLVEQAVKLHARGREIILVSSGAVAAGREKLRRRPSGEQGSTAFKQVLASIGQSHLMSTYDTLFSRHDITIAQALLTRDCVTDRAGYLNARNTLLSLCEMGVICIVNENDVVAVEELGEHRFGDNDTLSAMVANLVDADLLVILTDTGGLYTADPRLQPDAELLRRVEVIDERIEAVAGGTLNRDGIGGMSTKIEAAKLATHSGVEVVIANGRERNILLRVDDGEATGTLFPVSGSRLESRKRWMLSGLACQGRIVIDAGAVRAMKRSAGSLLPAGVIEVVGAFSRGDIVDVVGADGSHVARGIVNYDSNDVAMIQRQHSDRIIEVLGYSYGDEVVHRNNMVVL